MIVLYILILFTMNIITPEKSILKIYLVSTYQYEYFFSLKFDQPITMSFYEHSMNYLLNICVLFVFVLPEWKSACTSNVRTPVYSALPPA